MNYLVLVGVSHHTAPIEVRERLAFPDEHLHGALQQLQGEFEVPESLIVSTCNRVEVIAEGNNPRTLPKLKEFISRYHSIPTPELESYLYAYRRNEAVRHIFRVASSLDSMVVGEPQILSQIKQAYQAAVEAGSVGNSLNSLLPRAFFVAKRIRTETRVGTSAVSISSVAVELARKIFGDLRNKSVLMVGAGKMGELAARNLISSGASEVFVTNRTAQRAHQLAAKFHGSSIPFHDLDRYLVDADIVLVSTGASQFVLDRDRMLPVIRKRKFRPLFVIDISVPRNVDPRVNEIDNIFLYDVDDLQSVIDANLFDRRKEAELAEEIVNQEVENYIRRLTSNSAGPIIAQLRRRVEEICLEELKSNGAAMDPHQLELMERILRKTAHRVAHPLIMKLKEDEQNPALRLQKIEWIKSVFNLDDEDL